MTTFSKTAENFNVYVLDNAEAVSDLVETQQPHAKNEETAQGSEEQETSETTRPLHHRTKRLQRQRNAQ